MNRCKFFLLGSLLILSSFVYSRELSLTQCVGSSYGQEYRQCTNDDPLLYVTYDHPLIHIERVGGYSAGKIQRFFVNNGQCKTNFRQIYPRNDAKIAEGKHISPIKVEDGCELQILSFEYKDEYNIYKISYSIGK